MIPEPYIQVIMRKIRCHIHMNVQKLFISKAEGTVRNLSGKK